MRWDGKEKDNGWYTCFAIVPIKIGDTWIWLEPYAAKQQHDHRLVQFYSGCAERVGWPCDCYRH